MTEYIPENHGLLYSLKYSDSKIETSLDLWFDVMLESVGLRSLSMQIQLVVRTY